jgi:hypothetical protein
MADKKLIIRGLDSPEHLKAWMEAAGREWVVLRVADILDMSPDDQRLAIQILIEAEVAPSTYLDAGPNWRPAIQRLGVNGYIKIHRDKICALAMDDLQVVQQWISVYRDVRLGKGEPSRTDPCEKCGGRGQLHGQKCEDCDGGGEIITFLEISDEELALMEGRTP